MTRKKKSTVELFLIQTDENGNETRVKIKKEFTDLSTAEWWIKKAIAWQEYEDNQPEAGMASGCW